MSARRRREAGATSTRCRGASPSRSGWSPTAELENLGERRRSLGGVARGRRGAVRLASARGNRPEPMSRGFVPQGKHREAGRHPQLRGLPKDAQFWPRGGWHGPDKPMEKAGIPAGYWAAKGAPKVVGPEGVAGKSKWAHTTWMEPNKRGPRWARTAHQIGPCKTKTRTATPTAIQGRVRI